jgi:micrococcal nuclease
MRARPDPSVFMKRTKIVPALALACLLFPRCIRPGAVPPSPPEPESLTATVGYVYDGDTIKVRLDSGEEKSVRLIGVDSPELDDVHESVRLSAFLAQRFVHSRLYLRTVRLTRDRETTDAFGRLLAYVWTDGTMFNGTLLREGYAKAYLKYPFDASLMRAFREAEAEARFAEKGLWRKSPVPVIGAAEARERLGQVVTVRYRCARAFNRGRFHVLAPAEGVEFEAVVARDVLSSFPGALDFAGRMLEITGFVEEFAGRPQIMIGVPLQLRAADPAAPIPFPFDTGPVMVYINVLAPRYP